MSQSRVSPKKMSRAQPWLTPQFSSNQALNPYAIFQGVGKSHFENNKAGGLFFLAMSKENT